MERTIEKIYEYVLTQIEKIIGSGSTTTIQLDTLGNDLFGKAFIGTYASDIIPSFDEGYCIVNLDPLGSTGSHWTSICKSGGKTLFYDSFGRSVTELLPKLKKKKIVNTDKDAEQLISEYNCGARCLAFIYCFHRFGFDKAKKI